MACICVYLSIYICHHTCRWSDSRLHLRWVWSAGEAMPPGTMDTNWTRRHRQPNFWAPRLLLRGENHSHTERYNHLFFAFMYLNSFLLKVESLFKRPIILHRRITLVSWSLQDILLNNKEHLPAEIQSVTVPKDKTFKWEWQWHVLNLLKLAQLKQLKWINNWVKKIFPNDSKYQKVTLIITHTLYPHSLYPRLSTLFQSLLSNVPSYKQPDTLKVPDDGGRGRGRYLVALQSHQRLQVSGGRDSVHFIWPVT